ncbi:TPA: hypothetical protein EYG96_03160, partial [Candidatus Gracilibacteria bacterium]|nr:hypothetical protein [Candidatus Gracilibacteria bacterium]
MNKQETRKEFQIIRKKITTENKNIYSEIITEKLKNSINIYIKNSVKNKTLNICLFAATKNEPNITNLLTLFTQEIIENKINFYFPKCENYKNTFENIMNFYSVNILSDLEYLNTKFNILEPNKNCIILDIQNTQIDLFIIPAVSIDQNKNRIGMGAGFYDRYFNKYFTIHNKKNSTI